MDIGFTNPTHEIKQKPSYLYTLVGMDLYPYPYPPVYYNFNNSVVTQRRKVLWQLCPFARGGRRRHANGGATAEVGAVSQ